MATYHDFAKSANGVTCTYYMRPSLVSQNKVTNATIFRSTCYLSVSAGFISWSRGSCTNHTKSFNLATRYNAGTHTIGSIDIGVSHDSAGVFPQTGIAGSISTTYLMAGNCDFILGRGEYATIPRASDINAFTCNSSNLNGTYTYKYTPKLASYYNRLRISIPNVAKIFTTNLGAKAVSQQTGTFALTTAQLTSILNYCKSTDSTVVLGCVIETYSDSGYSAKIGESKELKLTMKIPTMISIGTPTAKDTNATITAITGNSAYIVQGKSSLSVVVPASSVADIATTTNKATITKYVINVNGIVKELTSAGTLAFGVINVNETFKGTITVYDSRGNSKSAEFTVNVLPYAPPKLDVQICTRSNSSGVEDLINGTYLSVLATFSVQSVKIGTAEKNAVASRQIKIGATVKDTTFTSGAKKVLSGLATSSAYTIEVNVTDKFGEIAKATRTINVAALPFHIKANKKGLAFFMMATEDNVIMIPSNIKLKWGSRYMTNTDFDNIVIDK